VSPLGVQFQLRWVFLAVARVRVIGWNRGVGGCQSGCSSIFYGLFLGGGVCGLRRCRSAIQLLELLVVLSRPGFVWDFFRYHCHITLNGSVVVPVHCIVVYRVVLFLYREGFVI